jgi:hypothetical protein
VAEDRDNADTPSARNREVIQRPRWKRAWSRGWFFFWLSVIAGTLLGGCVLPWLMPGNPFENPWSVVGFLGPLVGLGGVLLMVGDRSRYRRSFEMARHADAWGLVFVERPDRRQYGFLQDFTIFGGATTDFAQNFMSGPTDDGE